jgi:Zn-dependent protease
MLLVHQAAQNIWGAGLVGFVAFVVLYAIDFWLAALVHEAGHAIAARSFKWKISYIAIFPVSYRMSTKRFSLWGRSSGDIGGVVAITAMPGKTKLRSAIFYAAGPVANLLLAAIAIVLAIASSPSMGDVIGSLAMMSLLLGIGNLLPWRSRDGAKSDGAALLSLIRSMTASKRTA